MLPPCDADTRSDAPLSLVPFINVMFRHDKHNYMGKDELSDTVIFSHVLYQLSYLDAGETTRWQYTHGVPDQTLVSPDGQNLDNFYLARPGADEVQLDLFGDYKSNVALYPSFQEYFRTHKPPLLAVWGKNDPFFLPPGAGAFRRDIPEAVVRFFDTGHFALETHSEDIARATGDFWDARFVQGRLERTEPELA